MRILFFISKLKYLSLLIILLPLQSSAQSGSLYLTNFTGNEWEENQNWSIVQDDLNNMVLANRRGIIVYSGDERQLVQCPSMAYTLSKDNETDKIYVGSKNRFGYIKRNTKGTYRYNNILTDSTGGNFTQIILADSTVYFMGEKKIYRIHKKNQKINNEWKTNSNHPFTGLFKNSEHIFINVWNKGLHRLESDTLFPIVSGFWTKKDQIIFNTDYDKDHVLIGTDNNELYLFDGMKFYRYKPENHQYLKESTIMEAINLPENLLALGTMAGGVVIINKKNDKSIYRINYSTGLPGDEIYALAKDNNGGLWISHNQGLTRASLNLPVKNFATYPGLKGRPLKTAQVDSTLFVATTNSIYYLTKKKSYQRKTITIKEEISEEERKEQQKKQKDKEKPENFFEKIANKLFNKEEEEKKEEADAERQYKYRKKDIFSLESINYEYKEIEDIKGRYNQLLPFKNGMCVATNNGLFYINDQMESTPIIKQSHIYHIANSPESNKIFAATQKGILEVKYENHSWSKRNPAPSLKSKILSIAVEDSNSLWAGGEDILYRIKNKDNKNKVNKYQLKTRYPEKYKVGIKNDSIYLLLNEGIYKYHEKADEFHPLTGYNYNDNRFRNLTFDISQPTHIWVNCEDNWRGLTRKKQENQLLNSYLDLFDNIEDIFYKNDRLWIITQKNIYRVMLDKKNAKNKNFKAYFSAIREEGKNRLRLRNFNFKEESVALEFQVAAPNYIGQNKTKYQFYIEGMMEGWSEWRTSPSIQIFTKKGSYTVKARAKNIWGEIQDTQSIHFNIPPPFTDTIWFYGIITVVAVLLVLAIIKIREKKLQHDKKVLEQKVKERTQTIEDQKEEIKIQRDEIEKKKNNLQRKNEEITHSIEYASRIQSALMPMVKYFYNSFNDHFILFKPRDIVSGDFYWITQKDKKVFITAADCTGHGVPGAFMSMLGISFLNEIVNEKDSNNNCTASEILDELRKMVKDSLHQTSTEAKPKDGMDMAFCIIDYEKETIQYAGANNPLLIFRKNGEFEEIKADRMPVGIYLQKEEKPFTNHTLKFKTGDVFYMLSDGYPDQFGGPNDKKFKKKNLKNLLSDIYDRNMEEQHRLLNHNFEEWKGERIQTDDVILLGFRM